MTRPQLAVAARLAFAVGPVLSLIALATVGGTAAYLILATWTATMLGGALHLATDPPTGSDP